MRSANATDLAVFPVLVGPQIRCNLVLIVYSSLMIVSTAGVLITINDLFNVIERTRFPVIRNREATFITLFVNRNRRFSVAIEGISLDFHRG
ncbi:hypothetical protein AU509_09440 [Lonsdalea britannica]|nr:hypothetical protein AU509_09440 [Lonsdalea britannica]